MARKSHTAPFSPGWAALGRTLTQYRGALGLRALAALQPTGRGQLRVEFGSLGRFERGARIKLRYADHIDGLYGGGGAIATEIRRLWGRGGPKDQTTLAAPAGVTHVPLSWAAEYSGDVWVRVRGHGSGLVWLTWGPWRTVASVDLGYDVVFVTGKDDDRPGPAVLLTLSTWLPVHVDAGTGPPPPGTVIDIRARWQRSE